MDDLLLHIVDLEIEHPDPRDPTKTRKGEPPRTCFTKYNNLIEALIQRIEYISPQPPSEPVAFQKWVDTSTNPPTEKRRNGDNTGWITL